MHPHLVPLPDVTVENADGQASVKKPQDVGPDDKIVDVGPDSVKASDTANEQADFVV